MDTATRAEAFAWAPRNSHGWINRGGGTELELEFLSKVHLKIRHRDLDAHDMMM